LLPTEVLSYHWQNRSLENPGELANYFQMPFPRPCCLSGRLTRKEFAARLKTSSLNRLWWSLPLPRGRLLTINVSITYCLSTNFVYSQNEVLREFCVRMRLNMVRYESEQLADATHSFPSTSSAISSHSLPHAQDEAEVTSTRNSPADECACQPTPTQ
jgi:hypothetical protein